MERSMNYLDALSRQMQTSPTIAKDTFLSKIVPLKMLKNPPKNFFCILLITSIKN